MTLVASLAQFGDFTVGSLAQFGDFTVGVLLSLVTLLPESCSVCDFSSGVYSWSLARFGDFILGVCSQSLAQFWCCSSLALSGDFTFEVYSRSLAQFGDFAVGVFLSLMTSPLSLAQFGDFTLESCSVW